MTRNRSKIVFFLLSFLLISERFISFYFYQFLGFSLPGLYLYVPIYIFLFYTSRKMKITYFITFCFLGTLASYFYQYSSLRNPGETLSFYVFVLSLFLFKPSFMRKYIQKNISRSTITLYASALLIGYFISSLWGEYYFVLNVEAKEGVIFGFIWPHGFGYFATVLSFILARNKRYWGAAGLLIYGASVGSRTGFLLTALGFLYLAATILKRESNTGAQFFNKIVAQRGLLICGAVFIGLAIPIVFWELKDYVFSFAKFFHTFDLINFQDSFTSSSWVKLTAGRSMFWSLMANYFFSSQCNFIEMFTGLSPLGVRNINDLLFGLPIWMHNDWLQALFAYGFVGFTLYLTGVLYFWHKHGRSLLILSFILLTSILNGLYTYMGVSLLFLLSFQYYGNDN